MALALAAIGGADARVERGHDLQIEVCIQQRVQRLAGLQVVEKLEGQRGAVRGRIERSLRN